MKPYTHKAKIAFLMNEDVPSLFLQLEDKRIFIVEISEGHLANLIADGVARIVKSQPGASASSLAPTASASKLTPAPDADAIIQEAKA